MEYTELTADDQYRILEARLKQYEQRHFEAGLNLAGVEATGGKVDAVEKEVADLEVVANLTRERLATMKAPAKAAEPERPQIPSGDGTPGTA